jgi:hypothetical protein
MIDTLEGKEFAVMDLPVAFMQADMDTLVRIHFDEKRWSYYRK